jgi:mono/diheme cytochrome c family protein
MTKIAGGSVAGRCGAALALLVGVCAQGGVVLAQNADVVKAGLDLWRGSGCSECHGPFANGEKERDEAPTGADLRRARLDAAELKLTISCGRPGTGMPAFDGGSALCAGRQNGEYPAPRMLNSAEIDSVVTYLQARILGKGRITKQECLAYYYDKPDWCDDYN